MSQKSSNPNEGKSEQVAFKLAPSLVRKLEDLAKPGESKDLVAKRLISESLSGDQTDEIRELLGQVASSLRFLEGPTTVEEKLDALARRILELSDKVDAMVEWSETIAVQNRALLAKPVAGDGSAGKEERKEFLGLMRELTNRVRKLFEDLYVHRSQSSDRERARSEAKRIVDGQLG